MSDGPIIESIMENDRKDEVKEDTSTIKPVSHKEALNMIITLNTFLLK